MSCNKKVLVAHLPHRKYIYYFIESICETPKTLKQIHDIGRLMRGNQIFQQTSEVNDMCISDVSPPWEFWSFQVAIRAAAQRRVTTEEGCIYLIHTVKHGSMDKWAMAAVVSLPHLWGLFLVGISMQVLCYICETNQCQYTALVPEPRPTLSSVPLYYVSDPRIKSSHSDLAGLGLQPVTVWPASAVPWLQLSPSPT
ncbi:hypothetical protein C8Q74DRAFT_1218566 [Fomes fomentarius]|nr:hypothetical protein C8Q74DRAFT_1218566 [Fomes fomentarius]